MKKYIIACLALLFLCNTSTKAQYNIEEMNRKKQKEIRDYDNETINTADFIFEGVITKQSLYSRNDKVLFSTIIDIKKVFRGNLKLGTIELISPIVVDLFDKTKRLEIKEYVNSSCIFMCRKAIEYPFDSRYNIDAVDNKLIVTPKSKCGEIHLNYGYTVNGAQGLDTTFKSKGDLYRYLSTFPRMKIPKLSEEEAGDKEKFTLIGAATNGSDTTFDSMETLDKFMHPQTNTSIDRSQFQYDSAKKADILSRKKREQEKNKNDSIHSLQIKQFWMHRDSMHRADSLKRLNLQYNSK